MKEEFGIRVICGNPACGKDFLVLTENGEKSPIAFDDLSDAFEFKKKLETPSPSLITRIVAGTSNTNEPILPDCYECPKCNSFLLRQDVQHFVVRLHARQVGVWA